MEVIWFKIDVICNLGGIWPMACILLKVIGSSDMFFMLHCRVSGRGPAVMLEMWYVVERGCGG